MAATGRRWTIRSSAIWPAGLNAHGIGVAIPSYDLCPEVTVEAHHRGNARSLRANWRNSDSLWSSAAIPPAGIWPPACWRPTGRHSTASLPRDLVTSAYAISGLFDLVPLVETSINRALRLDGASARAASPSVLVAARGQEASMRSWATTKARNISGRAAPSPSVWGAAGVATRFGVVPGANHFTAIAPLADPASPMVTRLKQLAGR